MDPKKSLGQHWLHDEVSLKAMVRAGEIKSSDVVVEVGPGLGTLTKKLVGVSKEVIAIELDDILAINLGGRVDANNLSVVHDNILTYNLSDIKPGYKVVANIPYYLTSNLIRTLLEAPNPPSLMALLVQKEVAERIVAKPGEMSILSVSVQFYAQTKLFEVVPAWLFTPPPKVDSQIIQIKRYPKPLYPDVKVDEFFKIVKAGFSEKRKKLRSSLSGSLNISKSSVDEWLKKSGLSPDARAQELSLDDWHQLYLTKS